MRNVVPRTLLDQCPKPGDAPGDGRLGALAGKGEQMSGIERGSEIPADWYADPYGTAIQRYWNGVAWTPYVVDASGEQRVEGEQVPPSPHIARAEGHGIVIQNVVQAQQPAQFSLPVMSGSTKTMGLAVLLTVLFGPLGLFYVSIAGGAILTAFTVLTAGLGIFVTWPASIVWSIISVNSRNQRTMAAMRSAQPIHSQPYGHHAPQVASPLGTGQPYPSGQLPPASDPRRQGPPQF
jgi:hypothetical protein